MPKAVHVVASRDFARVGARVLEDSMLAAWSSRPGHAHRPVSARTSVCLAGGSTPRPVYEALVANADPHFPWQDLSFWFGDERWVDTHHPDSNYRMAKEALFDPAGIDAGSVHGMDTSHGDPATTAMLYSLPPQFDVMILGVGADGHTASIFPHSPAAAERERLVVPAISPLPPTQRVTITLPVIARAKRLIVLVAGERKAAAVAAALEADVSYEECPARAARDGIWVLDTDAAAGLTGR
jgi:6-phosphogluconolactonase